jgi:hypothetical protein
MAPADFRRSSAPLLPSAAACRAIAGAAPLGEKPRDEPVLGVGSDGGSALSVRRVCEQWPRHTLAAAAWHGQPRLAPRTVIDERSQQRKVVREILEDALEMFDDFQEGTSAKAWLFTILYSIMSNRWRRDAWSLCRPWWRPPPASSGGHLR